MKKLLFSLSMIGFSLLAKAQSENYMPMMQGLIMKMENANTTEMIQPVLNGLERVASAEPKEWLPKYYEAYLLINGIYATKDKSNIDETLDKADKIINEANLLSKNNDELLVLQAFSKSTRIQVNPMTRGMKYGGEANTLLEMAKKINPENPRIYFLQGQAKYFTPAAFGGGKDKAKGLFETAIQKYESFQKKSEIMPIWGYEQAKQMFEECHK